jgi:cell division septal protein FtsQ
MTRKKVKIRYKRLFVFLIFVLVFALIIFKLFNLRISNIYVDGNYYFSDQDIIEFGNLQNYPIAFFTMSRSIESNISKSQFIREAHVRKKGLCKIYIDVLENKPLFYDSIRNLVVLMDGSTTSEQYNLPILTNEVDGSIYDEFLSELSLINLDVYSSISEISYAPNGVDKKLFMFTMNDGNYIYLNLGKFGSVNRYFDMIVNFNNHKGILYLDSGEYFKILDN